MVISVAGIPLIGARLSVVLAGMETMLKYGIMSDWDQAIRATAARQQDRHAATALVGESPNEAQVSTMVA